LDKLRKELLTLAVDNEIRDSPTVNDITEKLNDLALCFKNKYVRYYDLKEILGKAMGEKFRVLVRHPRFNDYVKPGCTPQCVTYSDSLHVLSRQSTSRGHFYWTDKRLQHLVNSYYLLLDNLKSDSSGQSCLTTLKRKLGWDVTIPELRSMLDTIFNDYEEKVSCFLCFLVFFVKYRVAHQIFKRNLHQKSVMDKFLQLMHAPFRFLSSG
jgi:hypothetical protein